VAGLQCRRTEPEWAGGPGGSRRWSGRAQREDGEDEMGLGCHVLRPREEADRVLGAGGFVEDRNRPVGCCEDRNRPVGCCEDRNRCYGRSREEAEKMEKMENTEKTSKTQAAGVDRTQRRGRVRSSKMEKFEDGEDEAEDFWEV